MRKQPHFRVRTTYKWVLDGIYWLGWQLTSWLFPEPCVARKQKELQNPPPVSDKWLRQGATLPSRESGKTQHPLCLVDPTRLSRPPEYLALHNMGPPFPLRHSSLITLSVTSPFYNCLHKIIFLIVQCILFWHKKHNEQVWLAFLLILG